MGLHECPIEPDDWKYGPPDAEGIECPECAGMGTITGDDDAERTCSRCGGSGVEDPPDPEPDMDNFL
jgi:RecJ-like exonuclease